MATKNDTFEFLPYNELQIFEPESLTTEVRFPKFERGKPVFEKDPRTGKLKPVIEMVLLFQQYMQQIRNKLTAKAKERGLSEDLIGLWPPQVEAMKKGLYRIQKILGYTFLKSMVIASLTGTGKTEIAIFSALKMILEQNKKVLYLVPLRALAREKEQALQEMWGDIRKLPNGKELNIRKVYSDIEERRGRPDYTHIDLLIATNEKIDALIRNKNGFLDSVGLVIADEGDFISDESRGPSLEVVLTQLKTRYPGIQIIMLSATIPESSARTLALWLNHRPPSQMTMKVFNEIVTHISDYTVVINWRPVPLVHAIWKNGKILFLDLQRASDPSFKQTKDPYYLVMNEELTEPNKDAAIYSIALSVIQQGGQVVIFRKSRDDSVNTARELAYLVNKNQLLTVKQQEVLGKIVVRHVTTMEKDLQEFIHVGVAFHHAGVPTTTQATIERLFRSGFLMAIVSTTTLARGMNLPARAVIVADLVRWKRTGQRWVPIPLSISEYQQFVGRAGRPGRETTGIGFTIIKGEGEAEFRKRVFSYILGKPEPLVSQLFASSIEVEHERALRVHLLSAIAMNKAMTSREIANFFANTFLARIGYDSEVMIETPAGRKLIKRKQKIQGDDFFWAKIKNILIYLVNNNFLTYEVIEEAGKPQHVYTITAKGDFTTKKMLDPYTVTYFELAANKIRDAGHINILGLLHLLCYVEGNGESRASMDDLLGGWDIPSDVAEKLIKVYEEESLKSKITPTIIPKIKPGTEYTKEPQLFYIHPPITELLEAHADMLYVPVPDKDADLEGWYYYLESLFTAYMLYDWIIEVDEKIIVSKYPQTESGDLYRKYQAVERIVLSFAEFFKDYYRYRDQETQQLVSLFIDESSAISHMHQMWWRLRKGIRPELISLAQVFGLGRKYARYLYDANIKKLSDLIQAISTAEGRKLVSDTISESFMKKTYRRYQAVIENPEAFSKVLKADKLIAAGIPPAPDAEVLRETDIEEELTDNAELIVKIVKRKFARLKAQKKAFEGVLDLEVLERINTPHKVMDEEEFLQIVDDLIIKGLLYRIKGPYIGPL